MTGRLRISELAARSGFSPSALRYYERVGLLAATERSSGGYRLYDDAAVSQLRFIARAKRLGLSLEEIRGLVASWPDGPCASVRGRLRAHIQAKTVDVRARVADLTSLAEQLESADVALKARAPQGPCGNGCGCADAEPAVPGTLAEPVPVACTLDAGEASQRVTAWGDICAGARSREARDDGLRLRFPPDPLLAGRLAELAAREQACCPFFTFILRLDNDGLTLDVSAPVAAAGLLSDVFSAAS
jgi:DNA-binding transcriptional MerR regulator